MTFTQAVRTCLSKYGTFSGRASRAEYWWFALFTALSVAAAAVLDAILGTQYIYCLILLGLFVPLLAAGSRRLHDTDKTGWLNALALIPGVGGLILMLLLALEGDAGRNRYGEPPGASDGARTTADTDSLHSPTNA